jgi:hypothetical protein
MLASSTKPKREENPKNQEETGTKKELKLQTLTRKVEERKK